MPTDEEKMVRAESWAEVLYEIVPSERLEDSFRNAFAVHQSNFPLSAYDIKVGYERLVFRESEDRRSRLDQMRRSSPIEHCSNRAYHINTAGDVSVFYPGLCDEDVVLPCQFCRSSEFKQVKAEMFADKSDVRTDNILSFSVVKKMP